LEAGLANLGRHLENLAAFGPKVVVALNHFDGDLAVEHERVAQFCLDRFGVEALVCRHWAQGSLGAEALARTVARLTDEEPKATFTPLYPLDLPLRDKILTIARRIYRAKEVTFSPRAERELRRFEGEGFGALPVCIAKTPYSFSTDDKRVGAPVDHVLPVTDVGLSAGAGFVVALCGEIMTMPGLPRHPSADAIGLDAEGRITGLF
jgi:formate--tetrahydrofolate ligase